VLGRRGAEIVSLDQYSDDPHGVPFFHVPSAGSDKSAAEAEHLRLLKGNVDFVVLARYMQILSGGFIRELGVPIINIHHSFLPALIGAGPYAKAKERGVELRGDGALLHRRPRRGPDPSSRASSA
jgi:formyltetrahydrofolate hydrolase